MILIIGFILIAILMITLDTSRLVKIEEKKLNTLVEIKELLKNKDD